MSFGSKRRDLCVCDPFRGATVQTNAGRKWEIVVGAGGTPERIERPRALLTEELADGENLRFSIFGLYREKNRRGTIFPAGPA